MAETLKLSIGINNVQRAKKYGGSNEKTNIE
jgi:hypothetical protein